MIEIIEYKYGIRGKLEELLSRPTSYYPSEVEVEVKAIVDVVRDMGDEALAKLTKEFDGISISPKEFRVPTSAIKQAYQGVDDEFLMALREAICNVTKYHERQKISSWSFDDGDGVRLGERIIPLEKVGLYVPGGEAVYPSTIVMNAVPAKVAGVERVIVATPPKTSDNPYILVALGELGLDEVYTIGGAQAIAALAFGTETIPKVDKIVGPGNIYVALAKRYVYGTVDIDMIAGPSEIVILADEAADPRFVAADLLSQAEHGTGLEPAICVTNSRQLGGKVRTEISQQIKSLNRRGIIEESLRNYGAIIVVETLEEGIDVVNQIAPEHLELVTEDPRQTLEGIKNAGAIFLGGYSPVAVGDYFAGANHVLPTGGTAKFSSPLGVYDFVKRSSVIEYSKERIEEKGPLIRKLAQIEGFAGHGKAIEIREQ